MKIVAFNHWKKWFFCMLLVSALLGLPQMNSQSVKASIVQSNSGNSQTLRYQWLSIPGIENLKGRYGHTSIWTGSEMIIWGGVANVRNIFTAYNDGARYNPVSNTWTPVAFIFSNLNSRSRHTAVWTGTEMIIWGGVEGAGAYYNYSYNDGSTL